MTPRRNAWLEGSRRGLLIVAVQASPAPRVAAPGSVTVTAGPQYGAGWLHRVMLGRHYRDLWTTPVRGEVLDLARVGGGTVFAGSAKIVSRTKLWGELDRDPANRVDSRACLTARLLDVYVGDWDRHAGPWRWGRFGEGDARVWRPIPRDRDQPFS